jgi:ribosome-associated translation inhibitor RaiA
VKAPARERSLLEAIDKAVVKYDRNARKAQARG